MEQAGSIHSCELVDTMCLRVPFCLLRSQAIVCANIVLEDLALWH